MIFESLRQASLITRLGLLVSAAPLVMSIVFAIGPNECRLALMRPLSLAGIFAGVCSLLVGIANGVRALTMANVSDPERLRFAALVLSETVIPTFVAFACLTVAWFCVAIGMRKHS
jgi:hypothetical protein